MKKRVIAIIALIAVVSIALVGCTSPKKEEKAMVQGTEAEQAPPILLEPKASSVAVEEEKIEIDPVSANGNERIIASGRWFFSAHNIKEGYIDYYDKHANYLGRIQLANK